MPRKPLVILLAGAALAAAWLGWRSLTARPRIDANACRGCNVLLITIDTLRSDRLHAFGGREGLTPNLDRLAAEGLRLTRTYTPAPLTLPAHASILTASTPPMHGLRANGLFRLNQDRQTLATTLKAAGYRTGAFVGAFVLDARFGLGLGFDVYDDRYGERRPGSLEEGAERRAEEVIKPALAWINAAQVVEREVSAERNPAPWFAWIHLYDPHEPYRAPEPYASRYAPYDAEVAYVDGQIGVLLERLRASGALDRTLIAVAADHGESLEEHGERTHGVFAYDATLRVPWLLWAGTRVRGSSDAVARLIDLAPTVLDLVGVQPPPSFAGSSIVPRLRDGSAAGPVYFEAMDANLTRNWAPLTGVVANGFKLIDVPIPELYDLGADPAETTNLYTRDAARARTLEAILRNLIAGAPAGSTAGTTTLSAESRRRLQALGYVASSAAPAARAYTAADDPKQLIGPANELNDALAEFRRGSREAAVAAVRDLIRRHPQFSTPYGVLASMQHDAGDLAGAIATLEEFVRRGVSDQSVLVVLAGYLNEAGQLDRALALLQTVLADHPDYADALNSLGVVYSQMKRHDRAVEAFRRVLALDPTSATAYENLGVDDIAAGNLDAAVADLSRALEIDPDLAGAHNAIAVVFARRHDTANAVAHWTRAIELNPRLFDALYNLGTTLADTGQREQARPYLERFASEAPPSRYAPDIARVRDLLGK